MKDELNAKLKASAAAANDGFVTNWTTATLWAIPGK
jgi:hypothetical protein